MMEKIRRCVKKLRSSIKTHEEPDVVAMLSKITAKLPKAQNEIWRSARPNDSEHPMSIKRTGTSTARCAAFYDMRSALSDVSSGENNGTGGDCRRTKACSAKISTKVNSLVASRISIYEETENASEQFVSAFGRKGKQVGGFEDAKDITCLPGDELLITDLVLGRIQRFKKNVRSMEIFVSEEAGLPWATTLTPADDVAVTLFSERCVKVLNGNGRWILTFGENELLRPNGIACDSRGRFIVTDSKTNKVLMFAKDGVFLRYVGNSKNKQECFMKPRYVCVNANNEIIVSDSENNAVKIFNSDGDFVTAFGCFGKGDGQFKCPYGVCTNDLSEIFVADHYNSRVSVFTKRGKFIRHVVTHEHGLFHPQGIAIDSSNYLSITHGQFKATEVLTFKLSAQQ